MEPRLTLGFFVVLFTGNIAVGQTPPVVYYTWTSKTLPEGAALIDPPLPDGEGERWIRVIGTPGVASTTVLARIHEPAIQSVIYGVEGRVLAREVEGKGYLEMWNVFPDGSRDSTRALGEVGPFAAISGTFLERPFHLPFDRTGAHSPPLGLEINLVLAGGGEVDIGPLSLVEKHVQVSFVVLLAIGGLLLLLVLVTAMTLRRSAALRSYELREGKRKAPDAVVGP